MNDVAIGSRVLKQLDQLAPEQQHQVLAFAKKLSSKPLRGISGGKLLSFAGRITPKDGAEMLKVIEAGCEQVDADEW